jgi:hypothetical protein
MSNFNPEDKITYNELAPSLQELLNGKASKEDLNVLIKLINGIRLTVGTAAPTAPINNKEIWINTSTNLIMRYNNGWVDNNANLAKNIPTSDVGGNIWIADN